MFHVSAKMKVGDIARWWPETSKIFARYQIDPCCGADDTLESLARKRGLNLGSILEQLNDMAGPTSTVPERGEAMMIYR